MKRGKDGRSIMKIKNKINDIKRRKAVKGKRVSENPEEDEDVSLRAEKFGEWERRRSGWMHSSYFWIDLDIRRRVFLDGTLNCFG